MRLVLNEGGIIAIDRKVGLLFLLLYDAPT